MKLFFVSISILGLFVFLACSGNSGSSSDPQTTNQPPTSGSIAKGKGIGEIKEVQLNDPLSQNMIERGDAIYNMKCAACHRLDDRRVVGPGWEGLTDKRKPEWIMNMITNVDIMLDEDPTARALLKECLTRMPNQNVSIGDARDILEFMYQNDSGAGEAAE